MNVYKLIAYIPSSVKNSIIDFHNVTMKTGKPGMRVTLDRLLTDEEKTTMKKSKHIQGVDLLCHHLYAPEIVRSYFYVV